MSKKEHTAILRVGTQLVSQLVETLLHETEGAQPDPALQPLHTSNDPADDTFCQTGAPSLSTHILVDEYSHDPHFGWLVHRLQHSCMLGTFGNALPWIMRLQLSPWAAWPSGRRWASTCSD